MTSAGKEARRRLERALEEARERKRQHREWQEREREDAARKKRERAERREEERQRLEDIPMVSPAREREELLEFERAMRQQPKGTPSSRLVGLRAREGEQRRRALKRLPPSPPQEMLVEEEEPPMASREEVYQRLKTKMRELDEEQGRLFKEYLETLEPNKERIGQFRTQTWLEAIEYMEELQRMPTVPPDFDMREALRDQLEQLAPAAQDEVVEVIERYGDINPADVMTWPPLLLRALNGHLMEREALLDRVGRDVDFINRSKRRREHFIRLILSAQPELDDPSDLTNLRNDVLLQLQDLLDDYRLRFIKMWGNFRNIIRRYGLWDTVNVYAQEQLGQSIDEVDLRRMSNNEIIDFLMPIKELLVWRQGQIRAARKAPAKKRVALERPAKKQAPAKKKPAPARPAKKRAPAVKKPAAKKRAPGKPAAKKRAPKRPKKVEGPAFKDLTQEERQELAARTQQRTQEAIAALEDRLLELGDKLPAVTAEQQAEYEKHKLPTLSDVSSDPDSEDDSSDLDSDIVVPPIIRK